MESNHWYILRHPNPSLINDIFSGRRTVSIADDEPELPHFDYFIPFCEINFRPSLATVDKGELSDRRYEPMLDGDAFRTDLRSYVFVRGDARMVERVLSYSWNKNMKIPMRAQRERDGRLVVVSSYAMDIFRSVLRQMDFQICEGRPAVEDVREGDEVLVESVEMGDKVLISFAGIMKELYCYSILPPPASLPPRARRES